MNNLIYSQALAELTAEGPELGWKFATRRYNCVADDSTAVTVIADYSGTVAGTIKVTAAAHTLVTGDNVELEGDTFNIETDLLISSIGSLPKETPGLPIVGNLLKTHSEYDWRVEGFENVFAVGNVVTGRGNILESRKHGREITDMIIDEHLEPLSLPDPMSVKYEDLFRDIEGDVKQKINHIGATLAETELHSDEEINFITVCLTCESSAPSFFNTCAATPSPSRMSPNKMCSVPM